LNGPVTVTVLPISDGSFFSWFSSWKPKSRDQVHDLARGRAQVVVLNAQLLHHRLGDDVVVVDALEVGRVDALGVQIDRHAQGVGLEGRVALADDAADQHHQEDHGDRDGHQALGLEPDFVAVALLEAGFRGRHRRRA
jgi:hypothetical protein